MSTFVSAVFSERGAILALLAFAVWFRLRPHSSAARRWLIVIAIAYVVASMYAVPTIVARVVLERGFRPVTAADVRQARTAIVILGGGAETVHGWDDASLAAPTADAMERVLEAARVYQLIHPEWVISSGGRLTRRQRPDGVIMRDELLRLGVPEVRILLEAESQNTRDEAVLVEAMLRSIHAEQVVLVTSSVHMRRALAAFRAVNIDAVPAIARNPTASAPLVDWIVPYGLGRSRAVAHELLGIVYYTARGWCRF